MRVIVPERFNLQTGFRAAMRDGIMPPVTDRIPRVALAHIPPKCSITRVERMSPAFVKYHLDDGRVLHRFTRPEPFSNPHDHPWGFQTEILAGGYVEEVFTVRPDGSWGREFKERLPGSVYDICADHIHRIVELPARECWTLVRAGPHERATQFWRFGTIVQRRAWNARRWSIYRPPSRQRDRQLQLDEAW